MTFTLVLTRQPDDVFTYGAKHGRFGTMVVLGGEKVTAVQLLPSGGQGTGDVTVPGGSLQITADGPVKEVTRYTTMERLDGMVHLPLQPEPFAADWEVGNKAVMHLVKAGTCYRVRGGHTPAQRGILIHAAPHVGWLIGCISPRRLGDKRLETDSTYWAMNDLHRHVGSRRADLFVTDS